MLRVTFASETWRFTAKNHDRINAFKNVGTQKTAKDIPKELNKK